MNDFLETWNDVLTLFQNSEKGQKLQSFLLNRKKANIAIYPEDPYKALRFVPRGTVRVVILGQDPYHGAGQAQGLAFSVNEGIAIPPSLRNIFKEISRSFNVDVVRTSGNLISWAEQGVLLLNTILTVEDSCPLSHARKGWEFLTDAIVLDVANQKNPVVFMLWGKSAQSKIALIEKGKGKHLILCSNHPSPLSASRGPEPFLGNNHFKRANQWLSDQGLEPINWVDTTSNKQFTFNYI